jgi:acetyl esterase/lipase
MPSIQSKMITLILRVIGEKNKINHTRERVESGNISHAKPSEKMYKRFHITTEAVNGQSVYTISPKARASGKHIYYLHGGAYINGFTLEHWRFMGRLVDALGYTITVPDYPLPPTYHVHDVFAMVLPLYLRLAANVGPDNMTIMGDSAGGGMTLALAQKLRDEGEPQPSNLVLLSPWLDVTMPYDEIREFDKVDPFLGVQGLLDAGKLYANTMDRTDPMISPIYGSLKNLGQITVFSGTRDILCAQARRLKAKTDTEGVKINYYEYEDMVHIWMQMPIPEARQAIIQIVETLTTN